MAEILPHSTVIKSYVKEYLADAAKQADRSISDLSGSGEFVGIYKVALAADAVLSKLSSTERPRLAAARSIVQRVPLFLALAQPEAARVELRRLIEVTFWCIYFTDHPIEWESFEKSPSKGFETEKATPIAFCAHREMTYYANYARERFAEEPSGLGVGAINQLHVNYGNLSAAVHAGTVATGTIILPPAEPSTQPKLASFLAVQREVSGAACIVLSAMFRSKFDQLPPMHRRWFDWLIGNVIAKKIRSQDFGIS
jgi:hypothetical protein